MFTGRTSKEKTVTREEERTQNSPSFISGPEIHIAKSTVRRRLYCMNMYEKGVFRGAILSLIIAPDSAVSIIDYQAHLSYSYHIDLVTICVIAVLSQNASPIITRQPPTRHAVTHTSPLYTQYAGHFRTTARARRECPVLPCFCSLGYCSCRPAQKKKAGQVGARVQN